MPLELSMWRIDSGLARVQPSMMDLEDRLESLLAQDISIASSNWLVVGRQVPTPWGKLIDLLCMDSEGNLIVAELKRDRTDREIVAQALDYGSYVKSIQADDIRRIYATYQKEYFPSSPARTLEEAFMAQFKGLRVPEDFNNSHELVIVATGLDSATERIVQYLADFDVRINAVFFRIFKDGDRELLTRAWLRESDTCDGPMPNRSGSREKVEFNGEYYVNFGENDHRKWEDARRFGFVSAGHGPKYRDAIQRLKPGNRVWVNVPGGVGYVGVGKVEASAVPVKEFLVSGNNGKRVPLLQAGITASDMGEDADDPEKSEYVARIQWLRTVPIEEGVREPGFFGNQNCVAEPRDPKWPYTVERLKQRFNVSD